MFDDYDDSNEDVCLDILNDMYGHLDFSDMCKYHDLFAYDKLTLPNSTQLNIRLLTRLVTFNMTIYLTFKRVDQS